MRGASRAVKSDILPAGSIRLERVQLDYPIYRRLVWDRLREIVGVAFPSWRPAVKRVLDDVSLTVEPGEILGLLGRNGAGKTTLLKLISGMIPPSSGQVAASGRIMALLAMGTGFKGSFTGRENLYFGGLLLGLLRRKMDTLIDDIAAFADLGSALDQPYFTYSSGMRARLGFALATSVPADVVILDESLATGDSRFVARCYNRIQEIRRSGRTILFVSHNLGEMARMTERVVVLDGGRIVFDGPSAEGIAHYEGIAIDPLFHGVGPGFRETRIALEMLSPDDKPMPMAVIGAPLKLRLRLHSESDLGMSFIQLRLLDARDEQLVCYLMKDRPLTRPNEFGCVDYNIEIGAGETVITWHIGHWTVGEGQYLFDVYLGPPVEVRSLDVSTGRVLRKALAVNSVYENPFLKGAAARLELQIDDVRVNHKSKVDYAG